MKIKTDVHSLREAINKILSVVDKKNSRPILTYALITTSGNGLEISATDLEVSAKVKVNASSDSHGSFCVNAKNISDILRELPDNELILSLDESENLLNIDCGNIHFSVLIHKNEDFPQLYFGDIKNSFTIESRSIINLINKTSYAISSDETRLFLNGIFLQYADSKLRAVATDGHRLSLFDTELTAKPTDYLLNGIILPKKGVQELKKLAESYPDSVMNISVDESFIYANVDDYYFISARLIAREYPKYQAVIPSKTSYSLSLEKSKFSEAIKRIKTMSNEKSNGVRVRLGNKKMSIAANDPSKGEAEQPLDIDYTGKELEIRFNAKYLLESLSVLEDEDISIDFNNEISPVVLKSTKDHNYLGIIMPLKM
ncbi:MAG: DNA polymerase III subunit beta [Bdellovibrio sp. CG12_big_fil_rev_8_21_14_0_65_39_13]|nr:MAG: DNA polymerase III subunit beta [Bdellovibrio sp. CG22_combo_CG10-13_8_21_14_all_39_27]PIQ60752.1 MAG: DNA polymerase III subunit beta [Bdellovibrio sp. CG12_big_fil_rev_8_21_14_0_65_39_13]PIR36376.1 MAG: DNA polymerase III subunit beta [Bdellovibrio sp. CG11_big_fil_rev_8_21_14_0_20_39_38]